MCTFLAGKIAARYTKIYPACIERDLITTRKIVKESAHGGEALEYYDIGNWPKDLLNLTVLCTIATR